jgi:hypothetical protein
MRIRNLVWFMAFQGLVACGSSFEQVSESDGGGDAASLDSMATDTTPPVDVLGDLSAVETGADTGLTDTSTADSQPDDTGTITADTGPIDTGGPDTRPEDTGTVDTGPKDTGTVDTGPKDTGTVDTGPKDTGTLDTGPKDTGVDACPKSCSEVMCPTGKHCCGSIEINGCASCIAGTGDICPG